MLGPGRYDDLCTHVREQAEAEGAIVILINGKHGPGFSCQGTLLALLQLPRVLREVADQIEQDGKTSLT